MDSLFGATITHVYDKVCNRTLHAPDLYFTPAEPINYQSLAFDSRDQIDNDSDPANGNGYYDANGNTVTNEFGAATGDLYDAENHLIRRGSDIQIGYDHEGNRVWTTVNGTNTFYLLDDRNPSGYIQVLAEYSGLNTPPERVYSYGHELSAQHLNTGTSGSPVWTTIYYGYDGQGSVRLLTDTNTPPTITDTYDYDAYGVLLAQSSISQLPTPNTYRYTGQQWDCDLGMYFLRARYYTSDLGRFWTMDTYEGSYMTPLSLHKYLYAHANPISNFDFTGKAILINLTTNPVVVTGNIGQGHGEDNGEQRYGIIRAGRIGGGRTHPLPAFLDRDTALAAMTDPAKRALRVGWIFDVDWYDDPSRTNHAPLSKPGKIIGDDLGPTYELTRQSDGPYHLHVRPFTVPAVYGRWLDERVRYNLIHLPDVIVTYLPSFITGL